MRSVTITHWVNELNGHETQVEVEGTVYYENPSVVDGREVSPKGWHVEINSIKEYDTTREVEPTQFDLEYIREQLLEVGTTEEFDK